jgi:signal transduction histidine kinase
MFFSHFINPVDASDFTGIFLRNAITLGMLVPIYGLFCGKKYIFQIGFVYIFLYTSTLLRVHNQFLIENAPFLMLNGTIYFLAVYYILDILEKMRRRQIELNNDLKVQKNQLIIRNNELESKNLHIYQQSKELKELNSTKDKLFSIIAHDLRSPFNSILGFSELLSENIRDYDIEKSEEFIAIINSTAKHTLALLDNLLDWAKIQTGQMDYKPMSLRLQPVIQEIIDILNSSATIKNIKLNYAQSEDFIVHADPNMLKTILRNLIQNSIKFTNPGGKVDIYVVSKEKQVEVTVADNGTGMNETTRNKLFKKNANFTSFGTANESGSGLGLILCKEFVKDLGGKIWVESEVGKGSRFTFTLLSSIKAN